MSKLDELISKFCPNGIKFTTLGQSCTLVIGATPSKAKSEYWENGVIPWMSSGEVNNRFIFETEAKISKKGYDNTSTTIVPVHSIVIALAGQGKTRGKVAITEIELCTNQSLCSIICGDEVYYKFLYYYLDSMYWDLRAISNGDGSRGGLSIRLLSPYKIPIPPIEVQEEIVRILDEYSEKNAQLIDVLKEELESRKVQYAYYSKQLFTNYNHYPVKKLRDFVRVRMCKRIKKEQTNSESGIPFYKNGTLGKQADSYIPEEIYQDYKTRYAYPKVGEVMLSTAGTVGRTVQYDGKPAYFQDSNVVWLENNESVLSNDYLYWFCVSMPWQPPSRATIKHLHNDMILDTEIVVPSFEDQRKLVSRYQSLSASFMELFDIISTEIRLRQAQYEYYRDKLLTFREAT